MDDDPSVFLDVCCESHSNEFMDKKDDDCTGP